MNDSTGSFGCEHGPATSGIRETARRFRTLLSLVSMVLTVAAVTLSGCSDEVPTSPTNPTDPSEVAVLLSESCGDDCPGAPPPGQASINLAIPSNNSSENGVGGINWHATTLTIPANHWYYVEVREAISISSNPEYTRYYTGFTQYNGTVAGPFGVGPESFLKTLLGFQTPDGWYETSFTPVEGQPSKARKLVKGPATMWISRNWLPGSGSCVSGTPLGPWDLPDCPVVDGGLYYHSAPAYLLGGVHEVRIVPAAVTLQLSADPNDPLPGDSVTFDASTSNGASFVVTEWTYVANSGGSGSSPGTCQPPADPCEYAPSASGTMYVKVQVSPSGAVEQASARVTVAPDRPRLTANPPSITEGTRVTFTSSTQNGTAYTVIGWSWQPTTPPSAGMPATDPSSCGTQQTCEVRIFESGKMIVEVRINGDTRTRTAEAEVNVTACASTGDPVLDSPEVRKVLLEELEASGIRDRPNQRTRRERGGFLFQREDGSYVLLRVPNTLVSSCRYEPGTMPSVPASWTYVHRRTHIHPYSPGEPVYACPGTKDNTVVAGAGPSGVIVGGGDIGNAITTGSGGFGYAGYVLDRDGNIWRWNDPPDQPGSFDANRINHWKQQGGSACFAHQGPWDRAPYPQEMQP